VDIESLLRSSNDHSVGYVPIGATAFPVYGYARATLDDLIRMKEAPGRPKGLEDLRESLIRRAQAPRTRRC